MKNIDQLNIADLLALLNSKASEQVLIETEDVDSFVTKYEVPEMNSQLNYIIKNELFRRIQKIIFE